MERVFFFNFLIVFLLGFAEAESLFPQKENMGQDWYFYLLIEKKEGFARRFFDRFIAQEKQHLLGWREVPID